MLKHCSPSTVDLRRRSRRHLDEITSLTADSSSGGGKQQEFAHDTLSLRSCSTTSSVSSSSSSSSCCSSHRSILSQPLVIEEESVVDAGPVDDDDDDDEDGDLLEYDEEKDRSASEEDEVPPTLTAATGMMLRDAATSPRYSLRPKRQQQQQPQQKLHHASRVYLCPDQQQHHSHNQISPPPKSIPIKVYAKCLRSDIEYKTLIVSPQTTSQALIWQLLAKSKMKHRDPRLFYLTMDLSIRRTGVTSPLRRSLALDDEARPLELQACHPWGDCKFSLQMRKGGVVRVYDTVLMAASRYKCLLISESTSASEMIRILFHCYGLEHTEKVDNYRVVVETDEHGRRERVLESSEKPVQLSQLEELFEEGDPEPSSNTAAIYRPLNVLLQLQPKQVQSSWASLSTKRFVLRLALEQREPPEVDLSSSSSSELDTSYNSSGESTAESTQSSEYSALRFRDSPVSASSRSSASTDSGLLKSSPELCLSGESGSPLASRPGAPTHYLSPRRQRQPTTVSLHSLLEALPAASVDTGALDSCSSEEASASNTAAGAATSESSTSLRRRLRTKRTSLSSLSLESRTSDYDSYFYI